MKYIKEYNHEFYYEVSRSEFIDFERSLISEKDYRKIESFIEQINPLISNTPNIPSKIDLFDKYPDGKYDMIDFEDDDEVIINVQTTKDEWFLCIIGDINSVKNGSMRYYKCDQLEGLFKLIKDKYI